MRSIWKGAVSFGLVTIPVAMYTATENRTPKFKQLRESDHSAIRYKRVAESDGEEVEFSDIVRGYEVETGKYVVFTDDELEAASPDSGAKLVDVVQFVDADEVDAIFYQKTYYLAPEKTGIKAYKILVDALTDADKIALAKVSIREKQHMAALRVANGVLVMETMFWPDEIRQPEFEELETEVEIRPEEMAMAKSLIDNLTRSFEASDWVDTTREAVEELAAKKVAGEEIVAPEAPEPTKVIDLLEALKASVEATKSKRVAS
jgi:DNA end-binding protein Ku